MQTGRCKYRSTPSTCSGVSRWTNERPWRRCLAPPGSTRVLAWQAWWGVMGVVWCLRDGQGVLRSWAGISTVAARVVAEPVDRPRLRSTNDRHGVCYIGSGPSKPNWVPASRGNFPQLVCVWVASGCGVGLFRHAPRSRTGRDNVLAARRRANAALPRRHSAPVFHRSRRTWT